MNFADLTDTDFTFKCTFAGDACKYWDYDFFIERWDDKYLRNLSRKEIECLRNNCRGILKAIQVIQGE